MVGEDLIGVGDEAAIGGLRLLVGPPNGGKLGWVVWWWGRLAARSPLVVVPTLPDVTPLTLEIVERTGPVFGGRPVCTFVELVRAVTGRRSGGEPPPASELERDLVMQGLLSAASFDTLGSISAFPGAVQAAVRLVGELRESAVDATDVRSGLARWSQAGGGPVADDLGRLVADYEGRLSSAGRCDPADVVRRAIGSCGGWDRPVALYGFSSFTPVQRSLIRALAVEVPVLLVLTHDPGRAIPGPAAAEVALWRGFAVKTVHVPKQSPSFASPELAELDRLYLPNGVSVSAPAGAISARGASVPTQDGGLGHGVRLLVASGRRNEAELVGGEVVRLLREGVSPDDIVVLVRRVAPWRRVVEQVFRAYGIPYQIDAEVPLFETGLGQALAQGIRGVAFADLEPLLAYLRSPYHVGVHAEVDALELGLRRARNIRGSSMVDAAISAFPEALGRLRAALTVGEAGRVCVDLGDIAAVVWDMVQGAVRTRPFDSVELEEDVAAGAVAKIALEELDRACRAGWGPSGSAGMIAGPDVDAVLHVLERVSVRTGRSDERGAVQVVAVPRVRARRFSVVFLMGLVEGEFPEAGRPPALLGESQRRRANQDAGVRLFAEPLDGEEAALFSHVLSRPWQLLYLSTRDAEEDGKETVPSPFWTEVRRLLGGRGPWRHRTLRNVTFPAGEAPSEREYLRACAVDGLLPEDPALRRVLELSPPWRCDPEALCLPATLSRLAKREVFSATDLEEYARCPFGWFVGRLVRPGELEERLNGLHRGIIVHGVLADVYRALTTEALTPLECSGLPRAGELLRHHLERRLSRMASIGSPGELRLLGWEVSRLTWGLLVYDAERGGPSAPVQLEYALPSDGVDLGGIRISGRIDRVDAPPAGSPVFVIDYKSGAQAYGPRFVEKRALQVPLYLAALRVLWPEVDVAGGAYAALSDLTVRGAVRADMATHIGGWLSEKHYVDQADLDAEVEACLDVARAAAEGIRLGRIPAEPDGDCRSGCTFRPICRTSRKVVRWG
jgi:RecB family exonuclease